MRRTGETTRLVDKFVQELFTKGEVCVFEKNSKQTEYITIVFKQRMFREHPYVKLVSDGYLFKISNEPEKGIYEKIVSEIIEKWNVNVDKWPYELDCKLEPIYDKGDRIQPHKILSTLSIKRNAQILSVFKSTFDKDECYEKLAKWLITNRLDDLSNYTGTKTN